MKAAQAAQGAQAGGKNADELVICELPPDRHRIVTTLETCVGTPGANVVKANPPSPQDTSMFLYSLSSGSVVVGDYKSFRASGSESAQQIDTKQATPAAGQPDELFVYRMPSGAGIIATHEQCVIDHGTIVGKLNGATIFHNVTAVAGAQDGKGQADSLVICELPPDGHMIVTTLESCQGTPGAKVVDKPPPPGTSMFLYSLPSGTVIVGDYKSFRASGSQSAREIDTEHTTLRAGELDESFVCRLPSGAGTIATHPQCAMDQGTIVGKLTSIILDHDGKTSYNTQ